MRLGIDAFVNEEGGYTSVAMALALLVSLSLVLSLATASWVQNRSADVQAVADASALAGANVVASYATVATAVDACVLTMGLAGVVTLGAGLVASAVPGMSAAGAATMRAGTRLLDSRKTFATTAARGLRALEETLPLAIAARSSAVVGANGEEGLSYAGVAIPFPQASETDFSGLDAHVETEGATEVAGRLQEASDEAREAREQADEARREGWLADCGGEPTSLRERAESLSGISGADNPHYPSEEGWTFAAPLLRARAYYAWRASHETPDASSPAALTDSASRAAFYEYALAEVRAGSYAELPDGTVRASLPSLPANTAQMRETRLFSDARWPCSLEAAGRTLHSSVLCPGVVGALDGAASLADLERGSVVECGTCEMDASDLGRVASASTNIDNGFEHHWRRVVEASEAYEAARDRLAETERATRDVAEGAKGAFERALEGLSVPRPKLCPPGAWGCVSVVIRAPGATSPPELSRAFADAVELPAGAAVSAATLAPDDDSSGNDVITSLFGALSEDLGSGSAGVLGTVGGLWGGLLVGYGAAADGLASAADEAVSHLEGVPAGSAAAWLRDRVAEVVRVAGFEPADMRLRKPVLTNTQNVLDKAGLSHVSTARELVGRLPDTTDPVALARALGQEVVNELGGGTYTVAEIPIPGTGTSIPLTLDVGELLGAVAS